MAQLYSPDEISRHDSEKDLWMTMDGGVYNLTNFLFNHPGGEEVLIKLAGQDGTVCFDEIGHSSEAVQLRETYKIGEIDVTKGGTTTTVGTGLSGKKREPTVDDDDWVYEEPKKNSSPYLAIFLGLGVLVYAIVFYYIL